MNELMGYGLLWLSALSSASLLPGSSEIVMGGLWYQGYAPLLLWLVATSGNVTGSLINWWLGGQVARFSGKRWFPATPEQMQRAEVWMAKFGPFALLLSWVPVVGDPLTLVAGVLRMPILLFVTLVALAKGARYAVLLLLADQLLKPLLSQ
jgi:membrane protein YqaA with SNARE-associated domain